MSRMRYHATQSLAALALAAIPAVALAQAAAQPNPAADHLAAARTALNKVLNAPVPAADMFKKVADLKTEYLLLERAASTASPEWFAHYTMIDRLIGEMLGPSPSSTEPGAVGTSGRAGSATGRLEAGAAADLQEFRTHLMAFSAAMSAVTPGAGTGSAPAGDRGASASGCATPPAPVPPSHASATASCRDGRQCSGGSGDSAGRQRTWRRHPGERHGLGRSRRARTHQEAAGADQTASAEALMRIARTNGRLLIDATHRARPVRPARSDGLAPLSCRDRHREHIH